MRLALVLAAAALAAAPAAADAAVTVGSSLPESTGDAIECDQPCTLVSTAIPGATTVVPFDGVVTRWRMRDPLGPGTSAAILVVMRPQPDGSLKRVASSSVQLRTQEDGGIATTEGGNRIPPLPRVQQGDLLGLQTSGEVVAIAPRPGARSSVLIPQPPHDGTGVPVPGPPDAELLFNVDIEPDADRDGYGDETRDLCPRRADALNRPCVVPFGVSAGPPQTAVVGKATTLTFALSAQPAPGTFAGGWLHVSVAVPPGFRVMRADVGRFTRCTVVSPAVSCPRVALRTSSVQISGVASGTFFDRTGRLPASLRFTATGTSSLIDPTPADNTAVAELRLTDGVCAVDLTDRATPRANRIRGTIFGDRMAGAAGADRLNARSGRDCVRGGNGHDRLIGGPGGDRLGGGNGDDRIAARDGARDKVSCGPGDDLAVVDKLDRVSGCEKVRRP